MPDGRHRRKLLDPPDALSAVLFGGAYGLTVFEGNFTFQARYYIDFEEKVVYIVAILPPSHTMM